jgi:quinol-cytochrome oxidoreductase complex cytochrome b subunit
MTSTLDDESQMEESSKPNPAARYLVLIIAVAFYALTVVAYSQEPRGFSTPVYTFGAIGTVFMLLYFFASDEACDGICYIVTIGIWP